MNRLDCGRLLIWTDWVVADYTYVQSGLWQTTRMYILDCGQTTHMCKDWIVADLILICAAWIVAVYTYVQSGLWQTTRMYRLDCGQTTHMYSILDCGRLLICTDWIISGQTTHMYRLDCGRLHVCRDSIVPFYKYVQTGLWQTTHMYRLYCGQTTHMYSKLDCGRFNSYVQTGS
jgi:hypothetical protein